MKQTRRTVLKTIGGGSAALAAGLGTVSASPPSEGETIVDVAIGATEELDEFNVLVAAVVEAGLVDTLSGNRQFTVFAPTDEAFGELGVTADNVGDIDFEAAVGASLTEILTYHVAPGERDSSEVLGSDEIPTLNGAKLSLEGTTLNDGQADLIVELLDIEASNGFIHGIDGVLLP